MSMSKNKSTWMKGGLITLALLLAGCASHPKTVYNWDQYQTTVYQYYQSDKVGPEQQIASLKESIEKSRATNKLVPPGLHAQLGLLTPIPVIPIRHSRNSILRKHYFQS